MLIDDKVANDIITPDKAQKFLDETRRYDSNVDAAEEVFKLGDLALAHTRALLMPKALRAIQKEISNRARE